MGNHAMQVGMELGLAHGLGPAQRSAMWLLLKHYNDETGRCCPKIETLANAEGISYSAMASTLWRLMDNSCWERRMVGILYHYDLPPAIASTVVATKVAHDAGVVFDIEAYYKEELARLGARNNRPHFGSTEHLYSDHGAIDSDHGAIDSDHGAIDSDHGDQSERKKKGFRKEVRNIDAPAVAPVSISPETPTPRPALVPAAALAEPETAAAVYNTLEMPRPKRPDGYDPDLAEEIRRLHHIINRPPFLPEHYAEADAARQRLKELTRPKPKGGPNDNGDRPETLRQVPAEQADDGVPEVQQGDRRPRRQLQGVRGEEKAQSPPQEVRAVQSSPQPGRLPPAWQPACPGYAGTVTSGSLKACLTRECGRRGGWRHESEISGVVCFRADGQARRHVRR